MLVDLAPFDVRQIEHLPGVQHGVEPVRQLGAQIHPAEEDRHEERRELLVRDLPVGGSANDEPELLRAENAAIALLADQVVSAHEAF